MDFKILKLKRKTHKILLKINPHEIHHPKLRFSHTERQSEVNSDIKRLLGYYQQIILTGYKNERELIRNSRWKSNLVKSEDEPRKQKESFLIRKSTKSREAGLVWFG